MREQVEKIEFVIKEIVNGYFVAEQKLALLTPLLEDEVLIHSWDESAGVRGAEALVFTLYMAVLSDMRALLFDPDKRTASLEHVVSVFGNQHSVKLLRETFTAPEEVTVIGHDDDNSMKNSIEKYVNAEHSKQTGEEFDVLLTKTVEKYSTLKDSELAQRVISARSKMISHKEIRTVDGERALYNPTDFGLKWHDAQNIMLEAKEIIFNCNYLIHCGSYDLDGFKKGHTDAANSFWSRSKNA